MGLLLAMILICCATLSYFTSLCLSSLSYKMGLIYTCQVPSTQSVLTVLAAINIVTVSEESRRFLIYKPETMDPDILKASSLQEYLLV